MNSTVRYTIHKGFTLIELLIVILIVSIVYSLGFESIDFTKPKPKPLTPIVLKTNILNAGLTHGQATLMCLDKCRSCFLRPNLSSSFSKYPHAVDLQDLKVYTVNENDSLVSMEYGRYNDKEICLVMDFYKNGSSTQLILENNDGTYLLPSFFLSALRFDSPEEAKDYWVNKSHSLSDSGAFY